MTSNEREPQSNETRLNIRPFLGSLVGSTIVALTILYCAEKYKESHPPLLEGTIYSKVHKEADSIDLYPVFPLPFTKNYSPEQWRVFIAKCPKGELPQRALVAKECEVNSIEVSQEQYNGFQTGQYVNFKDNVR